ncbi:MAG: PAS domain S-box protein [Calditrichaceae bacterium]
MNQKISGTQTVSIEDSLKDRIAYLEQSEKLLRDEIDALKETEERYARIFRQSKDAIFIHDLTGKILDVNQEALNLFGYSFNEFVGMKISSLHPPDELPISEKTLNIVKKKEIVNTEIRFKKKNGEIFPAELFGGLYSFKGDKFVQGIVRDISDRKRAEKALSESKRTLQNIYDTIPDAVISTDAKYNITSCNQAVYKVLGYKPEELNGKSYQMIVAEEMINDPKQLKREKELFKKGYLEQIEYIFKRKNGEKFLASYSVVMNFNEHDKFVGLVGTIRDITERKKVETALKESEEKFRNLAEQSPNMIFINKNGKIVYVNKRCEEIMGYDKDEFYSDEFDFLSLIDSASKDIVRKSFRDHSQGKEVQPFEYLLKTKNNRNLNAILTTKLIQYESGTAILGIVTDITKWKQAELALKESEEKYRKFFEDDLTGDYITTPEGDLLSCNPAFAKIFGFDSVEDALKCNVMSFYPDPKTRQKLLRLLKKKRRLEYYEMELRDRKGKPVYIITNVTGQFDKSGNLTELKGYLFNNTKFKQLEEQFRQAQKMEAIGRLAGGIEHDFNNLLTIIRGYSELNITDLKISDPFYNRMVQIDKAAERAEKLTRQLLAFSRRQVLMPKIINMNELLEDIQNMIKRIIGEDIELITILEPKLGAIKADPGQVEQVIMNLVVNARDAMPQGEKLIIETRKADVEITAAKGFRNAESGEYIMLAISDTGVGMDEKVKSRIFEPFFTTKDTGKGTGLGLATVYGIVKQSGGYIDVYSQAGRGSAFKIYLPAIDETPGSIAEEDTVEIDLSGYESVLVVEDETEVRNIVSQTLTSYGYTVYEAADGQEAIQICMNSENTIHLIVSDIIMPRMSGHHLIGRVKSVFPDIKILFMSGYTDGAMIHQGLLGPQLHYLQKPFTPRILLRKVREVLDEVL